MNRAELLKIAKPILFNTEMVRAILDGRKTVTRRVIKPRYKDDEGGFQVNTNVATGENWVEKMDWDEGSFDEPRYINPPYNTDDILYVRETWQNVFETEYNREAEGHCINIRTLIKNFDDIPKTEAGLSRQDAHPLMQPRMKYFVYKASDIQFTDKKNSLCWRPSIHMPKEAARIFLRVTNVCVERLQDITEDGVCKEGAEPLISCKYEHTVYYLEGKMEACFNTGCCSYCPALEETYAELFGKLVWNKTIKTIDKNIYGWDANPWVWVIEFERVM